MARVFFGLGVLGGMMPLFMNAQDIDKSAEKVEFKTQQATNRPAELDDCRDMAGYLANGGINTDGLFAGHGSAELIADLAKSLILNNANDSVEAQATLLTWGSLRLLQ